LDIAAGDFVTVGLLVVLEGLLSADNALVMAIMVLGLPRSRHKQALRYGLLGGFAFRIIATLLAVYLIQIAWVKLLGGRDSWVVGATRTRIGRGWRRGCPGPREVRPGRALPQVTRTITAAPKA